MVDLWRSSSSAHGSSSSYEGPAHGYNNSCAVKEPAGGHPIDCVPGPRGDTWHEGYEDSLLEQQVLRTISAHDAATPLFLFWAPHIVHTPLQLPDAYMAKVRVRVRVRVNPYPNPNPSQSPPSGAWSPSSSACCPETSSAARSSVRSYLSPISPLYLPCISPVSPLSSAARSSVRSGEG